MAVTYQKAVRVRGTDSDGERGEKIFAEKYNKLAKAFNDHLSYGVGDTTWRLFFYAHSSMRSMAILRAVHERESLLAMRRKEVSVLWISKHTATSEK